MEKYPIIHRLVDFPKERSFFLFAPRQCGKSTLVRSRLSKKSWEVNLLEEKTRLQYLKNPSLFASQCLKKIKQGVTQIFVDEIQKIPSFLDEIHNLIEKTSCQFIMTGSSARKLKKGHANLLAGRALQRYLFPFIYREIKNAFDLEHILRFGSLPAIFGLEDSLSKEILDTYVQTYLKEEIQAEGLARDLGGFVRFLDLAGANFAEVISYANVARESMVSDKVVKGYYDILEDTLIGFKLLAWEKSVRKRIVAHPKFYFFDNGVINSLNRQLSELPLPSIMGKLFEQWMLGEIRAFLTYKRSDKRMYYWRTTHGAEVDLILELRGEIRTAIEFKYTSVVESKHLSGLRSLKEEYPKVPCLVVANVSDAYDVQGVPVYPWKEFLEDVLPKLI